MATSGTAVAAKSTVSAADRSDAATRQPKPTVSSAQPSVKLIDVDWDSDEPPPIPVVHRVWWTTAAFLHQLLPVLVLAAVIVGFLYWPAIRQTALQTHERLRAVVSPAPHFEQVISESDLPDPSVDSPGAAAPNSGAGKAATGANRAVGNLLSAPAMVRERVRGSSVRLEIEGMAPAHGVVCAVDEQGACILTNRSTVDRLFSITGGPDSPPRLPTAAVRVVYADSSLAVAHVEWVATNGIDLALLRTDRVSSSVKPALWRGGDQISPGDTVYFGHEMSNSSWDVLRTAVQEVGRTTMGGRSIPIVQVRKQGLLAGTGLYNDTGELVAIAGPDSFATPANRQSAIQLTLLEELKPPGLKAGQ